MRSCRVQEVGERGGEGCARAGKRASETGGVQRCAGMVLELQRCQQEKSRVARLNGECHPQEAEDAAKMCPTSKYEQNCFVQLLGTSPSDLSSVHACHSMIHCACTRYVSSPCCVPFFFPNRIGRVL